MRDTKHRVENALRKAREQKGLDYIEWKVSDDDLDYILNHYQVELLKYEVRRVFRPNFYHRSAKSNLVKELLRRKGTVSFLELTPDQVAECRKAGLEVTPRVYRIRHRKDQAESSDCKGRRSGRRNIGKNGCYRR